MHMCGLCVRRVSVGINVHMCTRHAYVPSACVSHVTLSPTLFLSPSHSLIVRLVCHRYLIAEKWWSAWKRYVNYDDEEGGTFAFFYYS